MTIQNSWLIRGYFDMSAEDPRRTTTQAIKDALSAVLGHPMRIAMYPVGPNWKHTFWWREGTGDYAEAQFFMRIAEDYPVLSLGVSVEKGLEGPAVVGLQEGDAQRMDRGIWDWQRLIDRRAEILESDVPRCAPELQRALNLRIRTYHEGHLSRAESGTFCFTEGRWFERHHGLAEIAEIAAHLEALDQRCDRWVDLYFAIDLDPSAADGLTATDVARSLVRFEPIRRRLRP